MASTFVQRRIYSLLWDGTNGQEVADLFTAIDVDDGIYTVVQQIAGDRLTLRATQGGVVFGEQTYYADRPYFVIDLSHGRLDVLTSAQLAARFMPTNQVPGPTPALSVGVGVAQLGALLLGGSTTVPITWDVTMPNTNYTVKWRAFSGINLLSMIVLNGTVTKTTTGCTIPIRANGLASAAGLILAEAYLLA